MAAQKLPKNSVAFYAEYVGGATTGSLAKKYGVNPGHVVRYFQRRGLPLRSLQRASDLRFGHGPEESNKECTRCHVIKPLIDFYRKNERGYHLDRRRSECIDCFGARVKLNHAPLEIRRTRNLKKRSGQAANAYARGRKRELRTLVLAKYGNQCECCGEFEARFLTIDHVNNDGCVERASDWGSVTLMCRLSKLPRQSQYRLLCFNCNCGRALNRNICPHEEALRRYLWAS